MEEQNKVNNEETKKKAKKWPIVVLVLLILLLIGSTFAWLSIQIKSTTVNKIKAGSLSMELNDEAASGIKLLNAVPMSYQQGIDTTEYTFTLTNNGAISDYKIALIDELTYINEKSEEVTITEENKLADTKIRYILKKNEEVTKEDAKVDAKESKLLSELTDRVIDSGTIQNGETITYHLFVWIDSKAGDNNTQDEVMGKVFNARLRLDAIQHKTQIEDQNIQAAYTYNQEKDASNYCVTGEEATCAKTDCYKSNEANSCKAGDIIEYKVNDTDVVKFHVMFDEGETITMQSQKNIIDSMAWINQEDYAAANTDNTSCGYTSCTDEGPMTILPALEQITSTWTNVNDQTYTMGETIYKTNAFTGCEDSNMCTVNIYTLPSRTAKARMITLQEASDLGCTFGDDSCPNWMYSYLSDSSYQGLNEGYWIMNVDSYIDSPYLAWLAYYSGGVITGNVYDTTNGARAVVVISK